jgi:hypothetical protein
VKRTSICALHPSVLRGRALRSWAPVLCTIVLAAFAPSSAEAIRGVENYPKVLAYTSAINLLPPAVQDTLSWFDLLVCMDRPETIASLRQRNPHQRYLWEIQPQYTEPYTEENPWWLPDTTWSAKRLVMYYVKQNNWTMRDVNGQVISDGILDLINWTRYCPVGTYGTAKGLRASQWMASVALPTIALSGRGLPPWSWDSTDSYNGYMFEILADCLGSYGWENYQYADPNQDGIAEGVTHSCSMGGTDEPLSILMREENEEFYSRLSAAFPADFVFTINENTDPVGPWWRTRLSGMKLENWMRGCCPPWSDWWDWFYGKTPPYLPGTNWGAGYFWAEQAFDKPVEDRLKGWDLSFIVTWKESGQSEEENLQRMRFGLGTSMLGDGYFEYSLDDRHPQWQPEFDWDFGAPTGPFTRETRFLDTLYVRTFSKGMVEVNPGSRVLGSVPARDTRFTFWVPVSDLTAAPFGPNRVRVRWTAPHGDHGEPDSYELRYATEPITMQSWDAAVPYAGNPVVAEPGELVSLVIGGLPGQRPYYLATRSHTRGHLEPVLSNLAEVQVDGASDLMPPGQIADLRSTGTEPQAVHLQWTATGDDGDTGEATRTLVRYLEGEAIDSEAAWTLARDDENVPSPPPAGGVEVHRLQGLRPETLYGIAVRAEDEAGNRSPLGPCILVRTASPPPPPPPDRSEVMQGDGDGNDKGNSGGPGPDRSTDDGDAGAPASGLRIRGPIPGDGPDVLSFEIDLPIDLHPEEVTLQIQDDQGAELWSTAIRCSPTDSRLRADWPRKNARGERIGPGTYYASAVAGRRRALVRFDLGS